MYPDDLTIISRENEEIECSKYILSLFSPTLRPILATLCCTSPTLLLPDCSASSIRNFLNIIYKGFTYKDNYFFTNTDINQVVEISNFLDVDINKLACHGDEGKDPIIDTVPAFYNFLLSS